MVFRLYILMQIQCTTKKQTAAWIVSMDHGSGQVTLNLTACTCTSLLVPASMLFEMSSASGETGWRYTGNTTRCPSHFSSSPRGGRSDIWLTDNRNMWSHIQPQSQHPGGGGLNINKQSQSPLGVVSSTPEMFSHGRENVWQDELIYI